VFESLRQSFRDLFAQATTPGERRAAVGQMKETLVQARLGVEDLRKGVDETRRRLGTERAELETIDRRRGLAERIGDAETVAVADRFAQHHGERIAVLERKLAAQEEELALVEAEVREMTEEFKRAAAGRPMGGPAGAAPGGLAGDAELAAAARALDAELDADAGLRADLDALGRQQRRTAHDDLAAARLAELKRRMGK
jgi:hypothetical protein